MSNKHSFRFVHVLFLSYALIFLFSPWNRGLFFFEDMIVYDVLLLSWSVVSFVYVVYEVISAGAEERIRTDVQSKKKKKKRPSGEVGTYAAHGVSGHYARQERWTLLAHRFGLIGSFSNMMLTWGLLLLSIWYVIRAPFGVQASNAWDQAYRIAAVVLSFIVLGALFRTEQARVEDGREDQVERTGPKIIGLGVFATLAWTSIFALLAAVGLVEYQDAVLGNRLSSVYQYPNTYGATIGALLILTLFYVTGVERSHGAKDTAVDDAKSGIKDVTKDGTKKERFLFPYGRSDTRPLLLSAFKFVSAWLLPLLWVAFIYSFSRGAWVLLPVFWWLGLWAFSWRYQMRYIGLTLGSVLVALPIIVRFNQWMEERSLIGLGLTFGASLFFAVLVMGMDVWLNRRWENHRISRAVSKPKGMQESRRESGTEALTPVGESVLSERMARIPGRIFRSVMPVLTVLLGGVGFIVLRSEAVLSRLPGEVAARLKDISLSTQNTVERFNFYKDSLKLMRDYPLFGAGGDAWRDVFLHYQSYPYFSTQTHSFIFQLALETGLLGLILFGLALAMLIIRIIFALGKLDASGRFHLLAYTLAMFYLFAHAQIDFDFSYGFILLLFWTLWALVEAYMPPFKTFRKIMRKKEMNEVPAEKIAQHTVARPLFLRRDLLARGSVALLAGWIALILVFTVRDAYAYSLPVEGVNLTTLERNILQKKSIRSQDRTMHMLALQAYEQIYQQTKEARWLELAKEEALHLERVSPFDPRVLTSVSRFWVTIGDGVRAQEVASAALKTAPWFMPAMDWKAELTGKELLQSAQSVSSWSDPAFQSELQKARETFSTLQARFEAQRAFLDAEPPVSQYPSYQLSGQFLLYEGFTNVLASQRGSEAEKQALSEMWAHIASEKNTATLKELYAFMISLAKLNGYTDEAERMRSEFEANVPKDALQGLEDTIHNWQRWLQSKP